MQLRHRLSQFRRRFQSDETVIRKQFRHWLGHEPDLGAPATFNEKIQWLKLNDRRPLHTRCADKLAVRSYVADRCGDDLLIPLLATFDTADALTRESLPNEPFAIKCTHDSQSARLFHDPATVNVPELRAHFARHLSRNYYTVSREWQYRNIPPRIIAERMISDDQAGPPRDFKLFCIHGEVVCIQVDSDRSTSHTRRLYTPAWQPLDIVYKYPLAPPIAPPEGLSQMQDAAAQLSEPFLFARIDFYQADRVYFGEITFAPEGGYGPFDPPDFDRTLGAMIDLDRLSAMPAG